MGMFHPGVPPWLVTWAVERAGLTAAVETGTYLGATADLLGRTFGTCFTVERDAALAASARELFADRPDVEVLEGSSRTEFPVVLERLDRPALFWLDAHWSAGNTAGEDDKCPLLAELSTLSAWPHLPESLLLIDDARLFGFGHELDPVMDAFPRMLEVLSALEAAGLRTLIADDVIIGVPPAQEADLLTYGQGRMAQEAMTAAPPPSAEPLRDRVRRRLRRTLTRQD